MVAAVGRRCGRPPTIQFARAEHRVGAFSSRASRDRSDRCNVRDRHQPVYYLPKDDVRFDLLQHTDHQTYCPRKGDAEYWSIVVGDRRIENAVWGYPVPLEGTADLSAYVAFYWNKVDNWFEEDEEVFVHARDPYKRVDALHSSRHVEVRLHGETIAETTKPSAVSNVCRPLRHTQAHVGWICCVPSALTNACPYQDCELLRCRCAASEVVENVAWVYRTTIPQVPTIENHLCFFNERVDILVDAELQERPKTAWS